MLIVANWKENPLSISEAEKLFSSIPQKEEVVVCPPHCFLYLGKNVTLGAQDCSAEKEGSFTGEVSAYMLKDIGCHYVIVGHSERRRIEGRVRQKAEMALSAGVTPIICIAETEDLEDFVQGSIVAYEPLSSIGTGDPCPLPQAREKREAIRGILGDVPVLYGGSVNEDNVQGYIEAGFDGVLVGGASLDSVKFKKIIEKCSQNN